MKGSITDEGKSGSELLEKVYKQGYSPQEQREVEKKIKPTKKWMFGFTRETEIKKQKSLPEFEHPPVITVKATRNHLVAWVVVGRAVHEGSNFPIGSHKMLSK